MVGFLLNIFYRRWKIEITVCKRTIDSSNLFMKLIDCVPAAVIASEAVWALLYRAELIYSVPVGTAINF